MRHSRAGVAGGATPHPADGLLVIWSEYAAPAALLYRAWTDPEHLACWSVPRVFAITRCESDLRIGGAWRTGVRAPDGLEYSLGGVYRELVPGERLVLTYAWDDAAGQPGPETSITVTFRDFGGRTAMSFRQGVFRSRASRDGHRDGWLHCFRRLDEHLRSIRAGTGAR